MNKQFNPFPDVSSHRGAPMGRRSDDPTKLQGMCRLHARHQGYFDGYDKGGAYWGHPSDVWGVWGWVNRQPCVVYVRARDRAHAIDKVRKGAV